MNDKTLKTMKEIVTKLCQNPSFGLLNVDITQSLTINAKTIILIC